jgi:NADPH:quinone reductase
MGEDASFLLSFAAALPSVALGYDNGLETGETQCAQSFFTAMASRTSSKFEDRPEPQSRDTDILVEVHATSVNPVDTKVRKTGGGAARALPLILGYDVSGVVVACGSRVTQWKAGDEIFAAPNLFRNGANAEYVAIDARSAARKPASLDHAMAAALPLVCQTAWEALHLRAASSRGKRF